MSETPIKKKAKGSVHARILDTTNTTLLSSVRYTEKSICHTYCYKDEDNKNKLIHWNFSCPMCLPDSSITLSGLRKLCDAIRNNFGVDLTKDIEVEERITDKGSPIHFKYKLRRNKLTREQLLKRTASCLFTIGVVKYNGSCYYVSLNDGIEEKDKRSIDGRDIIIGTGKILRKDKFIKIRNHISYAKKVSFNQKICTDLVVLNDRSRFADESKKLISSKHRDEYFKERSIYANNMYSSNVLNRVISLSKLLPDEEAKGILRSLTDYKNSFKEQREEIEKVKIRELSKNMTDLFSNISEGNNKEAFSLVSKVINVTNARNLKKKKYKISFIIEFMCVLSSFMDKKIENSPKILKLEEKNKKLESENAEFRRKDAEHEKRISELEKQKSGNDAYWKRKYLKLKSKYKKKHS